MYGCMNGKHVFTDKSKVGGLSTTCSEMMLRYKADLHPFAGEHVRASIMRYPFTIKIKQDKEPGRVDSSCSFLLNADRHSARVSTTNRRRTGRHGRDRRCCKREK